MSNTEIFTISNNAAGDGSFKLTVDKGKSLDGIDHLQIDATVDGIIYSGYISVNVLKADRVYNISCVPSVYQIDGNDNSIDNLLHSNGSIVDPDTYEGPDRGIKILYNKGYKESQ